MEYRQYCDISSNWENDDVTWSQVLQCFSNSDDDTDSSLRETDGIYKTLQTQENNTCEVCIACEHSYCLTSIVVVSTSLIQEIYDKNNGYIETVRGQRYDDNDDNNEELKWFYCVSQFDNTITNATIKFLSLEDPNKLHILHIILHFSCINSGQASGITNQTAIDFNSVRTLLQDMGGDINPRASSLLNSLEQQQEKNSEKGPKFASAMALMQAALSKINIFGSDPKANKAVKIPENCIADDTSKVDQQHDTIQSNRIPPSFDVSLSPSFQELETRLIEKIDQHEQRIVNYIDQRLNDLENRLYDNLNTAFSHLLNELVINKYNVKQNAETNVVVDKNNLLKNTDLLKTELTDVNSKTSHLKHSILRSDSDETACVTANTSNSLVNSVETVISSSFVNVNKSGIELDLDLSNDGNSESFSKLKNDESSK